MQWADRKCVYEKDAKVFAFINRFSTIFSRTPVSALQ
jgi:hypothetical protein